MDLSPDVLIVHERVRLRIMGLLYRQNDVAFGAAREALDVTAGNLASHVAKLQEAGLVACRDAFSRDGVERRIQITAEGLARFERYMT